MEIGLVEVIDAVRSELVEAQARGADREVQFPVGAVQLEFQVGVTREATGNGKLRVWVLELGGGARYERESVHTVTVNLEAPVDREGRPVKVSRRSPRKP